MLVLEESGQMPVPRDQQVDSASSPADWVDRHGDALFAYAYPRVRDRGVAEDLVQECFLAALSGRDRFAGQSSERTWLVGILKHKIVDHFRRTARETEPETEGPADSERTERLLFTEKGFWKVRAVHWGRDPRKLAENAEFWEVFRRCLSRLPRRLADAFTLREMQECDSDEVCQVLGIEPTNLWARLHRARLGLRHCLELHWFKAGSSGGESREPDRRGLSGE